MRNRYERPIFLDTLSVHAGTNYLNETGDAYTVEKAIAHPDYTIFSYMNDIGLLHLTKDIVYNNIVQPIPYAITNFVKEGDACSVCGWGGVMVRNLRKRRIFPFIHHFAQG